mgnify:CR=1 FL=1
MNGLLLRKNIRKILVSGILFFLVAVGFQIAFNLTNSDLTLTSRMKKYNASQTEIVLDKYYDWSMQLTDFSVETESFLDAYPGINYYTARLTSKRHTVRYEEYVDNDYDNYRVLEGKPLDELELYEVAVPAGYNYYLNSTNEEGLNIGDEITAYSHPLVVASIIDYIQYVEPAFNELTMEETAGDMSFAFEYMRFLASSDTITYINSQFVNPEYQSTIYKIIFDDYSKETETEFVSAYLDYFDGGNSYIHVNPFYEVLASSNGMDRVIGKTVLIAALALLGFGLIAIFVDIRRDLNRDRRQIGIEKATGISNNTIMRYYLWEFGLAIGFGVLFAMMAFLIVAIVLRDNYFYSFFLSKNFLSYLEGFAIILVIFGIALLLMNLALKRILTHSPAAFLIQSNDSNKGKTNRLSEKHLPARLGFRFFIADPVSSLVQILAGSLVVVVTAVFILFAGYAKSIYTPANYGLDYDYMVVAKYSNYSHIMDNYGESSLITASKIVWMQVGDDAGDPVYVKAMYVAYSGDLCNFLASGIDEGTCPLDSSQRGLGVVGYALAEDYDLEVVEDGEDSLSNYIWFTEQSLASNETYSMRIYGIQTILQYDGYVVFDRVGTSAAYAGRRFLDYYEDNTSAAQVYINLRDGADKDALETYLDDNDIFYVSGDASDASIDNSSAKLTYYLVGITIVGASVLIMLLGLVVMIDTSDFFYRRQKDFGILRSIGQSRKRIMAMNMFRQGMAGLMFSIIGMAIAFGLSNVIRRSLENTMGVYHIETGMWSGAPLAVGILIFAFFIMNVFLLSLFYSKGPVADLVRHND